ncbi:DDE-type integrase/transposase/recombinase [Ralstonia solanacearum]|uniref:integrase core domain-containing protein n=1 Tax=Ralstonia solanacearum species complex TaxID=3116862 RepID=UPI0018D0F79A|nr:DDE-type integrase/transposase/recombinase [Ralstonia solanacearum]
MRCPSKVERVRFSNGIKQKRTSPYHPWINGMVERMNRTIKDATFKVYECRGMEPLRPHVPALVQGDNFGTHLTALG